MREWRSTLLESGETPDVRSSLLRQMAGFQNARRGAQATERRDTDGPEYRSPRISSPAETLRGSRLSSAGQARLVRSVFSGVSRCERNQKPAGAATATAGHKPDNFSTCRSAVRSPACHAGGHGFKRHQVRQSPRGCEEQAKAAPDSCRKPAQEPCTGRMAQYALAAFFLAPLTSHPIPARANVDVRGSEPPARGAAQAVKVAGKPRRREFPR